jgi:hypothetical protein
MPDNKPMVGLILSPLLVTLLTTSAIAAQSAGTSEVPHVDTAAIPTPKPASTALSKEAVKRDFDSRKAQDELFQLLKRDAVAIQCGNYSVDHQGNIHCVHYNGDAGPAPNVYADRRLDSNFDV